MTLSIVETSAEDEWFAWMSQKLTYDNLHYVRSNKLITGYIFMVRIIHNVRWIVYNGYVYALE